jgi:UDP-N-acetylglucosamine 4,6-dehydratase
MTTPGLSAGLAGQAVLVTGGTGSFGRAFVRSMLASPSVRRVVVLSRDELKQWEMQQEHPDEPRLRFFLGDVRDGARLRRAFEGIDVVVHAAALKQIPAIEYNPFEAVRTNIQGAENVINAAIDEGVGRVVALSTDKASSPINLYGATKLVSDKLFVAGNAYSGGKRTRMAVVRYGNIVGSRGSVIQHFRALAHTGRLPVTDRRMTRFWITLEQAVFWVRASLEAMRGGEVFVPKLPSMRIIDLARAVAPEAELDIIGIRPGEKLHEEMISVECGRHALDLGDYYVIEPDMDWWQRGVLAGKPVPEGFCYASDTNPAWLDVERLRGMVADL